MDDGRIEFSKSAWNNFLGCSPSKKDKDVVKEELLRIRASAVPGEPVPFGQLKGCHVTWAGDWNIVYKRRNKRGIDVLDVNRAT